MLAKKIFDYGFPRATCNSLEAGHGKGPADGNGTVIKPTVDGYVNQGGDVTGSDDLLMALESKETSVKLMKTTEHQIKEIEDDLPISLNPIAKTMQVHQVHVFGIILLIFYNYVLYNECTLYQKLQWTYMYM